jgi:DNA-binding CsgD family transcriptional regulator
MTAAATSLKLAIAPPRLRGVSINKELTDREQEVAALAASGMVSKEIAEALGISRPTVDTHRVNIYRKLGNHRRPGNITDLVMYALARGLVSNRYQSEGFYGS